MTPKEKAIQLIEKYKIKVNVFFREHSIPRIVNAEIVQKSAKQLALISVDEVIDAIDFDWMEVQNLDRQHAYWEEVKKEIEKL